MMKYITGIYDAVKENEGMIYKLASNFSNELKEDLYQVGVIGLINAYNNYSPNYNTKFSTYAYPYVLGEMKKYVRENKGIKISRDIQYLSFRLDRLIELLSQKYNRAPTTKELSDELGIDEWKVIEALNIRNCIKSLDEPINDSGKEINLSDVIESKTMSSLNFEIDEAMNMLNEEDKEIIRLRYFSDKSQEEVAMITGYSQAKVSRMEQKILEKIKKYCD